MQTLVLEEFEIDEILFADSAEQKNALLDGLKRLPKQSMTVGFFGQDPEAKAYAAEFKNVFESAGFSVVRLEGFLVFDTAFGLEVIVYDSSATNNEIGIGIQKAFLSAGFEVRFLTNSNKMQPAISFNVHAKPPN